MNQLKSTIEKNRRLPVDLQRYDNDQSVLHVRVNKHTEAEIIQVAAAMNVSITEAVRILIGFGSWAWRSQQDRYQLMRKSKTRGAAERWDLKA